MEPNSKCPKCRTSLHDQPADTRCPGCGATWVREGVLRGCISAFLTERGLDGTLIAFHERPSGEERFQCGSCKRSLARVILRGVDVYRCPGCSFVLLEAGAVGLISQRVLLSATSQKRLYPMSGNAQLEAILRDPTQWGGGG
jgi:Zn-finger nucleic acid-binding protein